jgi:3-methyladenine DNA glycosylase AlkC
METVVTIFGNLMYEKSSNMMSSIDEFSMSFFAIRILPDKLF